MIPSTSATATRPKPAAKNKRRAPVRFDARSFLGRRVKALATSFRERLGDASDPLLLDAVERAAELQALAEDATARALRGDPAASLDDLVRLTRCADLAVRRLNLDRKPVRTGPTLSDYLLKYARDED